jgi:hypothetical protein
VIVNEQAGSRSRLAIDEADVRLLYVLYTPDVQVTIRGYLPSRCPGVAEAGKA